MYLFHMLITTDKAQLKSKKTVTARSTYVEPKIYIIQQQRDSETLAAVAVSTLK